MVCRVHERQQLSKQHGVGGRDQSQDRGMVR